MLLFGTKGAKMKNMTERIRQAKTWQERVRIAEDKTPGTRFDSLFQLVKDARIFATVVKCPGDRRIRLQAVGEWLADVIEAGNSQELHDLAEALNTWRRHKPNPDIVLVTLFSMAGMFYPGWERNWVQVDHATGKVLGHGVSPGTRVTLATRDFIRNIRRNYFAEKSDREWKELLGANQMKWEKKLRRYAKAIGFELDDKSGRPPVKSRHNRT